MKRPDISRNKKEHAVCFAVSVPANGIVAGIRFGTVDEMKVGGIPGGGRFEKSTFGAAGSGPFDICIVSVSANNIIAGKSIA